MGFLILIEDISFEDGSNIMAENVIVPEERAVFRATHKLEKIVEALNNKELLSHKIVIAIKDITDIVVWANGN